MNSNGHRDVEKSEKTKITIRLRRKDNNNSETNNISIPTSKTSFNLHKQVSLDPKNKHSTIDARNSSPLGHFNKLWLNQSQSLPTSPSHKSHSRISPIDPIDSTCWKEFRRSPVWKKESRPNSLLSESDSSSIASPDSAFEEGGSGNSAKPWRPGINYRPARPLYSMPRLGNQLRNRSSSGDSQSSGESTTPTPGSPKLEWNNFIATQQNSAHMSKHTRRSTEPASHVELNISRKEFSDQDRHILEGFFPTSSKVSGPKGHKNFINSAVYKENRASSANDSLNIKQSIKPPKIKPLTPQTERTIIDKNFPQRVRVFPENSPFDVISNSNPRVSSLVKHFDKPSSDVSSKYDRTFSQRPAFADKVNSNQSLTLPRSFLKTISQDKIPVNSMSDDLSASAELVKSKPYETNLFHCPTRRQEFLNSYLERMQNNKSSSGLLQSTALLSPIATPELKRACFYKQSSEMQNLYQMRPMSASVLLTKQDTFTNDPYKRKSFLDKYLTRQGHSNLISKKNTV